MNRLAYFFTLFPILISPINAELKLATFDVDATPPVGSELAYDTAVRLDEITLRCRGVALLGAGDPIVLCAIDWIGVANEAQDVFRAALAQAAGTSLDRVAVHSLHQHDAPRADFSSEKLIGELGVEGQRLFESSFQREVIEKAAGALLAAMPRAEPVSHYGWGSAEVKNVASNRRLLDQEGKVREMRWTTSRDPAIRAEPVGVIDPEVSLLSFWNGDKPVAVLSYYACHPQSYYRTGMPSPDFPGIARFLRGQGQPAALHLHFNGAGGNIGAGKYNDGNTENRVLLAYRLARAMREAWTSTEKTPLSENDVAWHYQPVRLPLPGHLNETRLMERIASKTLEGYAAISQLAFLRRWQAGYGVDISCLSVGDTRVLHMPGELFVEYQLAAKAMRPDLHVAMAAYGDYGTAYIGTAVSYAEGGYETSERATNVSQEAEVLLLSIMKELLEK